MLALGLCSAILCSGTAHAAAWPQPEGSGQLIDSFFVYTTEEFFDTQGDRRSQSQFSKFENIFYAEYGFTGAITAGGAFSLQRLAEDTPFGTQVTSGVGDTELFVRGRVWQGERGVLSLQPLVKLPAASGNGNGTQAGTEYPDGEMRVLYGHGFEAWGLQHFVNTEGAYRHRLGDPADEVRLDATLGLRTDEDMLWMAQVFSTFAVNPASNVVLNVVNSSDYDLVKLQLSGVATWEEVYSLQLGVFQHAWGQNTGAGGGVFLSFWVNF